MKNIHGIGTLLLGAAILVAASPFASAQSLGALAPENFAQPRPAPGFDLTGLWLHAGGPGNSFRFSPPEGFRLTPGSPSPL